jgi:hypothetical protein
MQSGCVGAVRALVSARWSHATSVTSCEEIVNLPSPRTARITPRLAALPCAHNPKQRDISKRPAWRPHSLLREAGVQRVHLRCAGRTGEGTEAVEALPICRACCQPAVQTLTAEFCDTQAGKICSKNWLLPPQLVTQSSKLGRPAQPDRSLARHDRAHSV